MKQYSVEQKIKNMLKDIDFCYLQEISLTNIKKNYWIQD